MLLEAGQGRLIRFDRPVLRALLANPEIAEARVNDVSASEELLWIYGAEAGETNLLVLDYDEQLMGNLRVVVRQNLNPVVEALRGIDGSGSLSLTPVGNDTLIVTGDVASPDISADIAQVANEFIESGSLIDRTQVTGPTQINLRVQIAEVSRTATQALGIDFAGGDDSVGDGSINFSSPLGLAVRHRETGVLDLSFLGGALTTVLDALESESLAIILSEPNLTTISGQSASGSSPVMKSRF